MVARKKRDSEEVVKRNDPNIPSRACPHSPNFCLLGPISEGIYHSKMSSFVFKPSTHDPWGDI
jgi:hypothetical protein